MPLGLACTLLCSCSTVSYYTQAACGQIEMMSKAHPVSKVLEVPNIKPLLKQKLTTVAKILAFAEKTMHLPAKGQYDRYSDLGRSHAVWVVFAAPEFSVTPKQWSYPLLGKLAYRGFFKESLAQREAAKLKLEGFDVHVADVDAYSTLGFLRDPLLNTFIGRHDADLAELLCHELTHQRLYLKGDTDFNEAFATAVGQEGARRWLRAQGRLKELAQYEKDLRAERAFVDLALKARRQLNIVYARTPQIRSVQLSQKQAVIERFKKLAIALDRHSGGSMSIERWFKKPVNNARLATLSTYFEMLPGIEVLFQQAGGDLETFFRKVEFLSAMTNQERRTHILSLASS